MAKSNYVVASTYQVVASILLMEINGTEYAEAFQNGKASELFVGKSGTGAVGVGGGYWLVNKSGDNVFLIKGITDETGKAVDIAAFVAKYNRLTYKVKVERISGKVVNCKIEHLIDQSAVIDSTTPFTSTDDAIKAKIAEKVQEGIVTKDDAEKRVAFMRLHGAKDNDILAFMGLWTKHEKDPEPEPSCKYQDEFLKQSLAAGKDGVILQTLRFCFLGYGVMVQSARGLGKYVLTQTIAWLLGLPIYHAIFSRDMTSEITDGKTLTDNTASEWLMSDVAKEVSVRALTGDVTAQAEMQLMTARAASVSIVVMKSEFYKCIMDSGLMAVDELNCGDPNLVEKIFNPLLDGQRSMTFPGIGTLTAKRPFCVIATMNRGYEGTADQNKATMSRFKWITLQYPGSLRNIIEASAKAELKSLGYNINIRKDLLDACDSFYNKIYKASAASGNATPVGQISDTALNIRGFVSALVVCHMFEGASLRQYLQAGVIDVCDEEEVPRLMDMMRNCVPQEF